MSIKSKSIQEMDMNELNDLNNRLRLESEVEMRILNLRRQNGENWDYDNPPTIDTKTPVGQLYPAHSDFSDKTISELTLQELRQLNRRLQGEEEIGRLILDLKRNSGEKHDYDKPPVVDSSTPVENLYHHGILGMKWGVRRYQNEDGTLTAEGRKHYGGIASAATIGSKGLESASKLGKINSGTKKIKKDYSDITDTELQKRVNRLNLEENYGRLTGDTKIVRRGSEWVTDILQTSAIAVSMAGTAVSIYLALKK